MKYCKTCNLFYSAPLSHCLFCNSQLEGNDVTSPSESDYHYPPFQRQKKAKKYFRKILIFLVLVAVFTCLFLDLTVTGKGLTWSLYTNSSLLYVLYVGLVFAGKEKKIKKITSAAYASVAFLLVIGLFGTDSVWAIDFILPLCLFAINICLTINFLARKRKALHDIAIYSLITSFLGLIPLILFFLQQLSYSWPALTCGLYSVVVIFGLCFFSTKETKDELKRRFHL
ncbi:MAG: DUF6320 domain-containing protein [Clostridiales bacterium]|nr:DUF6320 domain-containing protein [Clostridiales bacterium]